MSEPSAQQGWWAWLFNTSASTQSTSLATEHHEASAYCSSPSKTNATNAAVSSSPYGPYVRTGRGGAGNFQWQAQTRNEARDVEAQGPPSLNELAEATATIEHRDTSAAVRNELARDAAPRFVRVGRGGAGNVSLIEKKKVEETATSAQISSTSIAPASAVNTGRGGAGNFAAVAAVTEEADSIKRKEMQLEMEKQRAKAESEAQHLIQPPGQAWLGGKGKTFAPDGSKSWD